MIAFIVVVFGIVNEIEAAETIENKSEVIEQESEKKNEPQPESNHKNELATENNSLIKTGQAEDVPDDSTSKLSPPSDVSKTVNPEKKVEVSDPSLKKQMELIIKSLSEADIEKLVQMSNEEILQSNFELIDFMLESMTKSEREKFAEILRDKLLELLHAEEREERDTLDAAGYG